MKSFALFAIAALSPLVAPTAVGAQTRATGSVGHKAGAMTINQASGGGVRHGPRTARQPTKVPAHPSQGKKNVAPANTHATTSKGYSGVPKGPTR